jgi:hypothetical protein
MEFEKCMDDFVVNRNVQINNQRFNKLKDSETRVTSRCTVIFANGELDGPTEMNEKGEITNLPGIKEIISNVNTNDPSQYIKDNQNLANSVEHILIAPL